MEYKVILSGHFEFGSQRSFEKARGIYLHKLEKAYKNDVIIDEEESFDAEKFFFSMNRLTGTVIDRTWRNSISVLELLSEFAIAGSVSAWKLKEGKIIEHYHLEPTSEKAAVQSFLQGRELIVEGKKNEAKQVLSEAIAKFERHALAYERRGFVNFQLGNVEDALYDFTKSIDICPLSSDAFIGRAMILMNRGEYKNASSDLGMVTKISIPHQPIYWKARRLKGDCHLKLDEFKEAAREYKFFTNKKFKPENPNAQWTKKVFHDYGIALLGLNEYENAIVAFNKSIAIKEGKGNLSEADQFYYRGYALKKAGKKGYQEDLSKAADRGSDRAVELLAASS
jgi:tetratricopeptide (TPR) repeat protein